MKNIKAIIFDAYGTLFDVNSAAEKCKNKIGDKNFILIESSDSQKSIGKDQHFIKVQIDQEIQEGKIIPCEYTGIYNDVLLAKRI